ncbi:thiosulfate oxidation carrier protein SoxY [Hyphomicrobium sp.]|uniref:thiosulfate oxidation carrier protein SoxY n=1 Tax=Hyphomicrobium sp. TaxID=82 RepID=UPI002E2F3DE8|nr:thiosulfate oxidation carrier protein SoxY [Hyphomicrobium sp.]HEX2841260.1 thiosulfate oxidation carrier protein SoxY [Hyphomicrobium sp.]
MQIEQVVRTRREVLVAGAGAAALAALPWTPSLAASGEVDALIKKVAGDSKISEGRISLDLPGIAENGLVVPLNFSVESPMTADDYVKSVHFFADGNPNPQVADYTFTPLSPKAAAQLRIRLAKTQTITALAIMSSGEVFSTKKEVKVTIGGCGG